MVEATRRRALWLTGPASGVLFFGSLIGFAAARSDGYSHATKAVSELGSIGAPSALAFNALGFIVPGVIVVIFAIHLATVTGRKVGPYLLVASGASMILAGAAPAKLDDYGAVTTLLHAIGATGAGTLWVIALFWLGPMLRDQMGLQRWGRITPWFALFMFANIGWQVAFRTTGLVMPGWGQRLGFLGYFLWFGTCGILLWRHQTLSDRVSRATQYR